MSKLRQGYRCTEAESWRAMELGFAVSLCRGIHHRTCSACAGAALAGLMCTGRCWHRK